MRQTLTLRCACGWETRGTESEVLAATQEHGRRMHNMVPTPDEVRAMAAATATQDADRATPDGGAGREDASG